MAAQAGGLRLIVRIVLFAALGLVIVFWVIDRRARGLADDAYENLTALDQSATEIPRAKDVQEKLGREPDESKDALGGVIEEYHYASIPGRTYRVLVAYARDEGGGMVYVEHFLNEVDNENSVADQISKHTGWGETERNDEEAAQAGGGGGGRGGRGRGGFDPAQYFADRDADGDGKLSGDELSDRMRDGLEQIDTDGDGAVSLEEFQERMRQMRSRRGGGGGIPTEGAPPEEEDFDSQTGRLKRPAAEEDDEESSDDSESDSSETSESEDTPAAETPAAETPAAETPKEETPKEETPAGS